MDSTRPLSPVRSFILSVATAGAEVTFPGLGEATRDRVLLECELEDQRVLFPLTQRMVEISELLDQDRAVDPSYIEEGVDLWNRYVLELHERRTLRLLSLFPSTNPMAVSTRSEPPRRWRRGTGRGGLRPSRDNEAADAFLEVRRDQARMEARIGELRTLLQAYREGRYGARGRLASDLRAFALSDRAWTQFEDEFVLHALDANLPPDVDRRVRSGLAQISTARGAIQSSVQTYLARHVPVQSTPA